MVAGGGTGAIGGAGLIPGVAGTSGQVPGALKLGKSELLLEDRMFVTSSQTYIPILQ